MTAERRIICALSLNAFNYDEALKLLQDDWKLDPFFHQTGRPWTVKDGHVLVLVKGTPEEIAELNPFVELPKPEDDQKPADKFTGIVDIIDVTPEALEDGRVKTLTDKGYEVFNILKGSVILVKRKNTGSTDAQPEAEGTPVEVKAA